MGTSTYVNTVFKGTVLLEMSKGDPPEVYIPQPSYPPQGYPPQGYPPPGYPPHGFPPPAPVVNQVCIYLFISVHSIAYVCVGGYCPKVE